VLTNEKDVSHHYFLKFILLFSGFLLMEFLVHFITIFCIFLIIEIYLTLIF